LQRRTLNLGILAHVDAGKTTLTERLLYAAGVIDAIGSVDKGTTQTDSLALEQERGITIKSAVVSFAIDDVTVNLIDTPGHPDFIAEVERVLSVLDGAVLVISAVEGVQAQTPLLMRALRRLRVPTLLFVNKIDRAGADDERVLEAISERLTPAGIPLGVTSDLGTRAARFTPCGAADGAFLDRLAAALAERDEALLAAYVDGRAVPYDRLRRELAAQSKRALVNPVLFGSAVTGAGVDALTAGLTELLPGAEGDVDGPVSGAVFKIERGPTGDKIAYVRMFSGTVRTRDRVQFGREAEAKVTAISVFERGTWAQRPSVAAGEIGKLWGLGDVQIGDAIGTARRATEHHFAPPTLETVVVPTRPAEKGALRVALAQLAEQDPLIDVRQDDSRQEFSVSLYGEVQKEVIQATLASDYGLHVGFRESTTICVERPIAGGEAVEVLGEGSPFLATVGLRIEPAATTTGVRYEPARAVLGTLPPAFFNAVEDTVLKTLRQGIYGWQVTDCAVSTASDFRLLTPLVLMTALQQAGTSVCEPIHRFQLDAPADTLGRVLSLLARLEAVPEAPALRNLSFRLEGQIPAARTHELQLELRAATRGEGVLECVFDSYRPVGGAIPTRPRSDHNPLNRREYLLHVAGRA
jgi:ribosomal protection tetracycline resistance protein